MNTPLFHPPCRRLFASALVAGACSLATARSTAEGGPIVTNLGDPGAVIYCRGQGAGLLSDIAYPETGEKLPAIISVHGGRWRAGHKRDASAIKVDQWAGLGFFAMSIDYRLEGCTPAPACYQDFQCAIRYVHAQAEEYNVDTNRIVLIGQSAGGHLV